jgi:AcrR family transcriptional regulator
MDRAVSGARRVARAPRRAPRRDRVIERTRHDILEAAARAFAKSSARVTMKDIATEAGYTAASLYSYFESKEEIFAALAQFLQEELMATFDEKLPKGLSFAQRLEILLRRQLELADRRRAAFGVFFTTSEATPLHAMGARCPALGRGGRHKAGFDAYVERLARWIRAAGKECAIGVHNPDDLARALTGISRAFFFEWLMLEQRHRLADLAPLVLELFLYGALGGRTTK